MKLPVLIYHDVAPPDQMDKLGGNEKYYCLEQSKYRAQLEFLSTQGYRTITSLDDDGKTAKAVMLTFDDGLERHYDCFKTLMEHRLSGVFFIVTDLVGKPGYLTWAQIKEMARQGMRIQSHTCSHPIVTAISDEKLQYEFKNSRLVLEAELQTTIDSISIPQGFVNERVMRMAFQCGYRYVYTSEPGIYRYGRGKNIKRLTIFGRTTLSQFARLARMQHTEILKQIMYKHVLTLPKTLLGANNYHRLRTALLKRLN